MVVVCRRWEQIRWMGGGDNTRCSTNSKARVNRQDFLLLTYRMVEVMPEDNFLMVRVGIEEARTYCRYGMSHVMSIEMPSMRELLLV